MKKNLALLIILIATFSCNKEEPILDGQLKEIIGNELVTFSEKETPTTLQQLYDDSKILIFGESHYVQEHHEFIVSQLQALHDAGYRVIFDELFHCFSWMANDYVKGEIDELPEFILFFHAEILEGIRAFNSTLPDAEKFELRYMDVNHWNSNFVACIEEIEKILGEQAVFESIKVARPDRPIYKTEMANLKTEIESNPAEYISQWGQKWYDRIVEIVEVESESAEFRNTDDDPLREGVMVKNIMRDIEKSGNKKALVNTGSSHAQKEIFIGDNIDRIGNLLFAEESKTNSIVFFGIKGKKKFKFFEVVHVSFDLSQEVTEDDAMKEMIDLAAGNLFFMPLSNPRFSNTDIKISYRPGRTVIKPIGKQYDAIIAYPEVSVLKSMDVYDWE